MNENIQKIKNEGDSNLKGPNRSLCGWVKSLCGGVNKYMYHYYSISKCSRTERKAYTLLERVGRMGESWQWILCTESECRMASNLSVEDALGPHSQ